MGVRGVPVPPTFWTEGYRTFTFQDEKVKNLLSLVVNRGDLPRLSYNKPIFGWGFATDPTVRAHESRRSPRPKSRMVRVTSFPFSSPLL